VLTLALFFKYQMIKHGRFFQEDAVFFKTFFGARFFFVSVVSGLDSFGNALYIFFYVVFFGIYIIAFSETDDRLDNYRRKFRSQTSDNMDR